jgi:hypothetical protein
MGMRRNIALNYGAENGKIYLVAGLGRWRSKQSDPRVILE